MINHTPNNSCWLWCSFRIAKEYIKRKNIPKELHNKILISYLENGYINIKNYDNETIKEADLMSNLMGNAVEYLTLNGFYYDCCINDQLINKNKIDNYITLHSDNIFAILLQEQYHYMVVIKNNDDFILFSQTNSKDLTMYKLFHKNKLLYIPVNNILNMYVWFE